jgi:hypothetical protein
MDRVYIGVLRTRRGREGDMRRSLIVCAIGVALAGCGGDDDGDGGSNASNVSENDVIQALGLTTDESGSYTSSDGKCSASIILTGKQQVDTYVSAGDNVATNEDKSVGIKTQAIDPSASDQDCVQSLSDQLAKSF